MQDTEETSVYYTLKLPTAIHSVNIIKVIRNNALYIVIWIKLRSYDKSLHLWFLANYLKGKTRCPRWAVVTMWCIIWPQSSKCQTIILHNKKWQAIKNNLLYSSWTSTKLHIFSTSQDRPIGVRQASRVPLSSLANFTPVCFHPVTQLFTIWSHYTINMLIKNPIKTKGWENWPKGSVKLQLGQDWSLYRSLSAEVAGCEAQERLKRPVPFMSWCMNIKTSAEGLEKKKVVPHHLKNRTVSAWIHEGFLKVVRTRHWSWI